MSYAIDLSFKELDKKDIFEFIQRFKRLVTEPEAVRKSILENSVYIKRRIKWLQPTVSHEVDEGIENLVERLFTFKFIWIERYGLIACVIDSDNPVNKLFDGNIFFQNSTDQDYEYKVWSGIRPFREISDSVEKLTFDENGISRLKGLYKDIGEMGWFGDEELEGLTRNKFEYYKRTLIYQMIFNPIEDLVFGYENSILVKMISDPIDIINYRNFIKKHCSVS